MSARRYASVSLDLDNEWSYRKTRGDASWSEYPSYLDTVVPRALDVLDRHGLRITWFIVGQDAAFEQNHATLRTIAQRGHEIGNHSFHHEPWLHLYDEAALDDEIARAEVAIEAATGMRPVGFRGPGYSVTPAVVDVLVRRGYRYDASTLPTFIGPLARMYYFATSGLRGKQLEQRNALFGSVKDGLRPLRPYRWSSPGGSLVEVPVTTLPLLRIPIHVSYLLFLHERAPALVMPYVNVALALCALTKTAPSLLLHPLDFLGGDEVPALAFFPGMKLSAEQKLRCVDRVLAKYAARYELVTVGEHAARAAVALGDRAPVTA
ncbi:MAG TPA: polysaccharide deacetylase family protein [Candidatus Elarobacter sp.]|nr:polysaccharide deacetylase family protein [Candidatus Elarobacter sp.]